MLKDLTTSTARILKQNAPVILTAVGISGTITTAYLTGRASFTAAEIIRIEELEAGIPEEFKERLRTRFKLVWRLYIPPVVTGTATIGCIIAATRVESRRSAAIAAAYSISEKAFSEYKEKVIETVGEKKEKAIRDEVVKDNIAKNPPALIYGSGTVLCCELFTGRYFMADMETVRRAQNDVNAMLLRNDEATLNDLYYILGLPTTDFSGYSGWTSDKLLELDFTTVLSEDNRPCLAFSYNYTKPLS